MTTWKLVIEIEWPRVPTPNMVEALIRECVDPLHRENVMVYGVRLEQVSDEP